MVPKISRKARNFDVVVCVSQKAFVLAALAKPFMGRPIFWFMNDILSTDHFNRGLIRFLIFISRFAAEPSSAKVTLSPVSAAPMSESRPRARPAAARRASRGTPGGAASARPYSKSGRDGRVLGAGPGSHQVAQDVSFHKRALSSCPSSYGPGGRFIRMNEARSPSPRRSG